MAKSALEILERAEQRRRAAEAGRQAAEAGMKALATARRLVVKRVAESYQKPAGQK